MADDFKAGDTVELKSGSPSMTIDHVGPHYTHGKIQGSWCAWFDQKNKPQREWFPLTSLKKSKLASEPPPEISGGPDSWMK